MYIPFEQLSDNARIWIYQSNRSLQPTEQATVLREAQQFVGQWAAHGNPLQGSATILHDQFLIISVEENFQGATGCAIDASIQFIRHLEKTLQCTLLERTQIAFQHNKETFTISLAQLASRIQEGIITPESLTFDNTITRKGDLNSKWLIKAKDTWLSRYFI